MTLRAIVVAALVLALGGCRKPSGHAFYEHNSKYEVLVAQQGDEAYAAAEMDAVVAGLGTVPEGAKEKPQADALLAKIDGERKRIAAEAAAAQKQAEAEQAQAVVVYPSSPLEPSAPTPTPAVAGGAAASDAGKPADPELNGSLDLKALQAAYGSCLGPSQAGPVPSDGRNGFGFAVAADRVCRTRMKLPPDGSVTLYVVDGKLLKAMTTTVEQLPPTRVEVVIDGGLVVPPSTGVSFPGAPLPEGARTAPSTP